MALALAAVFGSMSLANPAQADSHTTLTTYTGYGLEVDLNDYFSPAPTGINDYLLTAATPAGRVILGDTAGATTDSLNPTYSADGTDIFVIGAADQQMSSATFTVTARNTADEALDVDGDGTADDDDVVTITVMVEASTGATSMDDDGALDGVVFTDYDRMVDVTDYFTEGMGTGKITGYAITMAGVGTTSATTDFVGAVTAAASEDGMFDLEAATATAVEFPSTDRITVTVTATTAFDETDADATPAVVDGVPITFFITGVAASTPVRATGSIAPQTVTLGEPNPTVDVSGVFMPGTGNGAIDMYQASSDDGTIAYASADNMGVVTLTGIRAGITFVTVTATDMAGEKATVMFTVSVSAPTTVVTPPDDFPVSLELSSTSPGKNARYTFKFNASMDYVPGLNDIVIKLTDGDFQVPETISTSAVTIQAGNKVASPADISVDDTEITLGNL